MIIFIFFLISIKDDLVEIKIHHARFVRTSLRAISILYYERGDYYTLIAKSVS